MSTTVLLLKNLTAGSAGGLWSQPPEVWLWKMGRREDFEKYGEERRGE